jgi:hypothetical protein
VKASLRRFRWILFLAWIVVGVGMAAGDQPLASAVCGIMAVVNFLWLGWDADRSRGGKRGG